MTDSEHRGLDLPLMSFSTEQEIAKLKTSDQWRRDSRAALTLVKTPAVTIVLLALHAGAVLKEHHAEGPITVAVLEGAIRFKASGEERVLRRGGDCSHLVTLSSTKSRRSKRVRWC